MHDYRWKPIRYVVDGVTYNTATSTLIAREVWELESEGKTGDDTLWMSRGGAFFVVECAICGARTEDGWREDERHSIYPMTKARAEAWIRSGTVELFDEEIFSYPPEAVGDADQD